MSRYLKYYSKYSYPVSIEPWHGKRNYWVVSFKEPDRWEPPEPGEYYTLLLTPNLRLMDWDGQFAGQISEREFKLLATEYDKRLESVKKAQEVSEQSPPKKADKVAYVFTKSEINRDALEQDTHWFDKAGKEYRISEMDPYHAMNAAKKLKTYFGLSCLKTPLFIALTKRSGYKRGKKD